MKTDRLNYWLRPKHKIIQDFRRYLLDGDNPDKHRVFIDRGAKTLFVAHMDTVLDPKFKKHSGYRIYATGLDDRLGCQIAYNLSARLGADLLLTDHEESCATTAQFHTCKQYNWIAEFDRAGKDVVTYDMDNPKFLKALRTYWKIGVGSFSDISNLDTTACCVNIGIGYEHAHAKNSYVDLRVVKKQIQKFELFFKRYKNKAFVHNRPADYNLYGGSWYGYRYRYNYDWDYTPQQTGQNYLPEFKPAIPLCDVGKPAKTEPLCEACGLDVGRRIYGMILCKSCELALWDASV